MLPAHWERRYGGNVVIAVPPELPARVRYHERIELRSMRAIVERILADDPEFRVHEVGAVERIVTVEGEYGAWVHVRGLRARRWIAAVFAGDVTSALDVVASARFDEVERLARELACAQRFELGARPRQFFYTPPRGWHGLPMGQTANWYPLDFPAHRTAIVVPPASGHALAAILEACAAGAADRTSEPFRSDGGLDGTHMRVHRDGGHLRDVIAFAAGSRVYYFRLETTGGSRLDEDRALFCDVARSVQPLPDVAPPPAIAFDHWAG